MTVPYFFAPSMLLLDITIGGGSAHVRALTHEGSGAYVVPGNITVQMITVSMAGKTFLGVRRLFCLLYHASGRLRAVCCLAHPPLASHLQ